MTANLTYLAGENLRNWSPWEAADSTVLEFKSRALPRWATHSICYSQPSKKTLKLIVNQFFHDSSLSAVTLTSDQPILTGANELSCSSVTLACFFSTGMANIKHKAIYYQLYPKTTLTYELLGESTDQYLQISRCWSIMFFHIPQRNGVNFVAIAFMLAVSQLPVSMLQWVDKSAEFPHEHHKIWRR